MKYYINPRTQEILARDEDTNEIFPLEEITAVKCSTVKYAIAEETVKVPKKKKVKPNTSAGGPGKYACTECGEMGHRAKTCGRTKGKEKEEESSALTEDEYDQVREYKNDGDMNSREIADTLGLSKPEVNAAFSQVTYEGYLKHR